MISGKCSKLDLNCTISFHHLRSSEVETVLFIEIKFPIFTSREKHEGNAECKVKNSRNVAHVFSYWTLVLFIVNRKGWYRLVSLQLLIITESLPVACGCATVSILWLSVVLIPGWSGLDDTRLNGWAFPGCSVCTSCQFHGQTSLHRPSCEDQVWIPHHYGWGKKVTLTSWHLRGDTSVTVDLFWGFLSKSHSLC